MTDTAIAPLAEAVDTAAMKAEAIQQISETTEITPEQGYDIQAASILRRVTAARSGSASRWASPAAPRWSRWASTT